MTTRRSFLGSILALGAAPAIVRADALMRVVPVDTLVLNAADVTWSAVDFDRDTIKVVLVYRDDGRPGGDHTAVTRIVRLLACHPGRRSKVALQGPDRNHPGCTGRALH